jgi:hypothetical protein
MYRPHPDSDSHAWLCTAYHEAGHAVAVLLLGRELYLVEVISPGEGKTWCEHRDEQFYELAERANREHRVNAELLRHWLHELWVMDAGSIAEAEFNLVPQDTLERGGFEDAMMKLSLIPRFEEDSFIEAYFYRHVGARVTQITEACRLFFRRPRVSALTRTLAEVLIRTRRLSGNDVVDTLLANRVGQTGQQDLFWAPQGGNSLERRDARRQPAQLRLFRRA